MNTKFTILKHLHTAAPDQLSCQDHDGNTAFHFMAQEDLQTLFAECYQTAPNGVDISNNHGQYPM